MKLRSLAAALLTAAVIQLTAYADTYDSITVDNSPNTGDTFTVSININSDDNIGYFQSSIEYDDSVIEYVGGDAVGGGGILTLNTFPVVSPDMIQCTLTFRAIDAGECSISLTNSYVFSPDGEVLSQPSSSASIYVGGESAQNEETVLLEESSAAPQSEEVQPTETSVTAAAETEVMDDAPSDEAGGQPCLIQLTCTAGLLDPVFSPDVYDYTVYADNSAETAQLNGTAADITDTVFYTGSDELSEGSNMRTVTVTSSDGRTAVYNINIIRAAPDENNRSARSDKTTSSAASVHDKYKDFLNPALAIVLVTLVVALFIVIYWVRGIIRKK
ncbi:cadherin-like beta sandwich domain-containing protein [uncultured Ruminococcus sp.]|uniref:cadherin-like beta sandwich domain-containing protein n=1 Tax=uncultured Ruminococcus sp. TaxID=165186 RepID=UPI0025F0B1FC|nr:cadherin-like beta sandwich domain-containing protein [uncultured Ruminococcus sp.]